MPNLMVSVFPVSAVLISVLACFCPEWFNWAGKGIVPLLGIIMFGMGATLSPKDFLNAVRRPKAVLIGMILQFGLMPLWGYCVGKALQLPDELFIGVVMVGTVAGGTASNVIAYLAGGDVALSITMTASSTALGVVLTPLLSSLYLGRTVDVPVWEMFQSILEVVALPVSAGLVVNRLLRRHRIWLEKACPVLSVAGIVIVIGIIMSLNVNALKTSGFLVMTAVILHNAAGLASGYFLARLVRCDKRTAVTIAIEVGMQNSGLAVALSKQFFSIGAALPGALFSIWHNISGALLAGVSRRWIAAEKPEAKNA